MSRIRATVVVVGLLGLAALSGRQLAQVFFPSPRLVVSENRAMQAVLSTLEMDYAGASALYAGVEPEVAAQPLHLRMHARTLIHLGAWETAARMLLSAGSDSAARGAAHSDAERLRALSSGRRILGPASGLWEPLLVRFAQNEGVGPVAVRENGTIATVHTGLGQVAVWTTDGALVRRFRGLGTPVAVAVSGERLLVADMAGGRILQLDVTSGAVRETILGETLAFGVRALAPGPGGGTWIADYGGGRVVRLDAEGRELATLGDGSLDRPSALLALGSDLLVAETGRDRVLRYDRNGRLLRAYVHPRLAGPVALAPAPGGFLVLGGNGLVFWVRDDEEDVQGPLPTRESLVQAGTLGIASDRDGNILWGDGRSLRFARRLPEDRPRHLLEIVRVEARRGAGTAGELLVTASVMGKDGRALRTLEQPQFRLIRGSERLVPIGVENLSEELPGRRLILAVEQSDALFAHAESVRAVLSFVLQAFGPADRAAVMDLRETFTIVRDFTASVDLVRQAVEVDRRRVAVLDVAPAPALKHGILLLAPTDYARAVLWVTTGEGLSPEDAAMIRRMGLVNQVPIVILHVGDANRELLEDLAAVTGGRRFALYDNAVTRELPRTLGDIRSGRYRIVAAMETPEPHHRGRWFDVTIEAYHVDGVAWDKSGYVSY